jgi:hypothetical protein
MKKYKPSGEPYQILVYLREKNDWIWGGQIERFFNEKYGESHKGSTTNRRCQELFEEGRLEKREMQTPSGTMAKQYRYNFETEAKIKAEFDRKLLVGYK